MAASYTLYRNYSTTDPTALADMFIFTFPPINAVEDELTGDTFDWSRDGYEFVGWNTARDGSGTSYNAGDTTPKTPTTYYATWREAVTTPPVEILLGNTESASLSDTGSVTLATAGTYVNEDITVDYTKSGGTPTLQSKTVSPPTSQQTVSPDTGYDGLSSVTVNAMPSGSATTPATTITANPTISVSASGLITASVSKTQGITPSVTAGYVSSGTSGTITVNGSNTNQLTVYNGAHHAVSSGYTVTVSLTNPVNASRFYGCYIENFTNDTLGEEIGRITTPTGSIELVIPVSITQISIRLDGSSVDYYPSNISCVGDVSFSGYTGFGGDKFSVTGNGAITYDGVDYDG